MSLVNADKDRCKGLWTRDRERQRQRETETERDRDRERQRKTETETERDRERDIRESGSRYLGRAEGRGTFEWRLVRHSVLD